MNKLIYTSFSPNTRTKDLVFNTLTLIKPWEYLKGKNTKIIEELFLKTFNESKGAYTFNYARSGMYLLFKSLNLPKDTTIIFPGFTCSAATNPAKWANLTPIYVDINKGTLNIDVENIKEKVTKDTRVLIFQHTFGNSKGIVEIKEFCKEHKIILIEDCTNTIFGKHKDKLIGSFGDASIFSFGRDKAISGVNGGLILINNKELIIPFEKEIKDIKTPGILKTLRELLYPIIWELIKTTYSIQLGKIIHLVTTKLNLITKATTREEKAGKIPNTVPLKLANSLAYLAIKQLEDIKILNNHRNLISNIYIDKLKDIKEIKLITYEKSNVPLRVPVLVKDRKKLTEFLKKRNIIVGDWYSAPITPLEINLEEYGYTKGTCLVSEKICNEIINLPTHINITNKDAEKITKLIREFYGY